MQSWALTEVERAMLLKLWILPLLVFPARAVFPTDSVISTLNIIYNVAPCLTSRDLAHDILALPDRKGGLSLPQTKVFLYWHHSTAFIHYVGEPTPFPTAVANDFKHFAHAHGISLRLADLPFFQMGSIVSIVVRRTMPYLARSARAFSIIRQPIFAYHNTMISYDTPMWHNNCFRNSHLQTYYYPQLIRDGQLPEDDSSFRKIAPTWQSVYQMALGETSSPRNDHPALGMIIMPFFNHDKIHGSTNSDSMATTHFLVRMV